MVGYREAPRLIYICIKMGSDVYFFRARCRGLPLGRVKARCKVRLMGDRGTDWTDLFGLGSTRGMKLVMTDMARPREVWGRMLA